jgi:hypothetical protein
MRHTITIIIIVFLWGCENKPKTIEKTNNETLLGIKDNNKYEDEWDYKKVNQNYIETLLVQICETRKIEFIDLYPILDSIASDEFEKLVLVDSLKTKGFLVTNWGRGNWKEGPRIVNFEMTKGKCVCAIDKLYYSTEQSDKFKVTERINCEQKQ